MVLKRSKKKEVASIRLPFHEWEINSFSTSNFKSIKALKDIPLKKVNLLYGQNSIGKSSLIQSLLVNRRNYSDLSYSSDRSISSLRFTGQTFDVGSFNHISYMHNENAVIELGNSFKGNSGGEIKVSILFKKGNFFGLNISLEDVIFGQSQAGLTRLERANATDKLIVNADLRFKFINNKNHIELKKILNKDPNRYGEHKKYLVAEKPYFEIALQNHPSKKKNTSLYESIFLSPDLITGMYRYLRLYGINTKGWKIGLPPGPFFNDGPQKLFKADDILSYLAQVIGEVIDLYQNLELIHIPPIRGIPGRSFIDVSSDSIDPSISYIYGLFNKNKRRPPVRIIRRRRRENIDTSKIIEKINSSLNMLGMNYIVSTQYGSNLGREGENLILKANDLKKPLAFNDVGKGISQVLPIIAAVHGERNKLILIEQPEIHLHPKLQADLMDVVIEGLDQTENKYFIETHSENLLLRVQRKVRNHLLDPRDVQIIYLSKNHKGILEPVMIGLDDHGRLDKDFPDGFLELGLNELLS